MRLYRVAPLAKGDLEEIWAYVAKDRPVAADRLIETFHHKFLALSSQPLMGESREDLAPASAASRVATICSSTALSMTK